MKIIIIAISLLIINVTLTMADVGKWLDNLTEPANKGKQHEAFYSLLKVKKEGDITKVKKYLTKKGLPENAKIDIIIILNNIDPDKKYWSEQLYAKIPKTKDEFWKANNSYRLYEILNTLKSNITNCEDETAWKYIRLYNGFSDAGIAEAFGPIYAYLLQNKTELFIRYLTHESNNDIRGIVSDIMQYDETLVDVYKNILKEKENDTRKQNEVIFKLRIYIDDYKINSGY